MKHNLKYLNVIAIAFIFSLQFASLSASDPYPMDMVRDMLGPYMKPDPRVWDGNITINRVGKAKENIDESRHGNIKTKKYSRKVEEKLVLKVCGVAGHPFYVKNTTYSYSDKAESHEKVKYAKTNCGYPPESKGHNSLYIMKHYNPIIKRPGNSMTHDITKGTYLCPENIIAITEPASATLMLMGEKYYLYAGFNAFLCKKEDDVQININVCSDTKKRVASHIEPIYPSTTAVIRKPEEQDDRWISLPPITWPVGMYSEDKISKNGNTIADTNATPIEKSGSHGYKEKTTYTWNLVADDKCQDIYDFLIKVLALAEAYADTETQNKAKDFNEYENKLVPEKACSLIPWCDENKDNPNEIDMAVNEDCVIMYENEFEEEQKAACEHPVIYEWEHKHEEEHVKQCKKSHEKFVKGGIETSGQGETSAYLLEAEGLLEWLKESCKNKGLDFKSQEEKIDELKAKKAGWWENLNK